MAFRHYAFATRILVKKNVLLSLRDISPLIVTVSSAFFSMLILYFSQISIDNGDSFEPEKLDTPDPNSHPLVGVPRCVPHSFDDCWTLAYVPDNDDVKRWVFQVASRSNIPEAEIIKFSDDDALNQHFRKNPNRTQAAYIFDQDSLNAYHTDNNVQFIVQYNDTNQDEFPLGSTDFHTRTVLPAMIHTMNLVLMTELLGKDVNININTSVFPHPPIITSVDTGALDSFGLYGALLTFGVYFLALVFFLYKIVEERERGLRDAMKLAGQFQSQHYISWGIPYIVLTLVLTLLLIAFGHIFSFKFFEVHDFSVYFLTMYLFALSILGWMMLVATLTRRSESVSTVAFNLFIFGYVISNTGLIVYATDDNGKPLVGDNVLFLRQLFAIAPSTMYIKALEDANVLANIGKKLTFASAGTYTTIFPIKDCWLWMLASGLITFILSIYLDNVLPSKHGAPLGYTYFLQPSYWGLGKNREAVFNDSHGKDHASTSDSDEALGAHGKAHHQTYNPDAEDEDVRAEREAVLSGSRDTAPLVIKNISKNFGSLAAVDDVSFSVKKNTAFALLGHNGAGKSTLFNMLVTSLAPSHGDASIFGLSVRKDQAQVRKLLGVCPQFDIFWDNLTGAEHIEIFAALKGLDKKRRAAEIAERLADVHLTKQANIRAGSYSGGMQRRLSVAISLTGDPKIVLLDECTSGADPLVRRDLWGTIERAKRGRVVFMITHSIAEAQHIAGHNAIGIMAKGKLRVLGKAMHLKSKFGAGYTLLAKLKHENTAASLAAALSVVCPGAALSSLKPGENEEFLASYSLPRHGLEAEIIQAVRVLEERGEEFGVSDYSLNSADLADVFKSITSLSEDTHEEDIVEKKKCRLCCWRK
ncbi:ABC transporter-like protein [Chondrus crispus]|uniref:Probable ATP-dependent transporter ycf16 n=1 Tax=Chondrus crispus TaxID=2769 RepID=R7QS59_CHOCR|nr:ABC transporter-like protein [Chondrus crispus]CDF40558.1 ABC transporter-like protein [Chondrus crispus]|eukprot:XP_005710852.1 ABC transporter-like protein [Chondrus crispus]